MSLFALPEPPLGFIWHEVNFSDIGSGRGEARAIGDRVEVQKLGRYSPPLVVLLHGASGGLANTVEGDNKGLGTLIMASSGPGNAAYVQTIPAGTILFEEVPIVISSDGFDGMKSLPGHAKGGEGRKGGGIDDAERKDAHSSGTVAQQMAALWGMMASKAKETGPADGTGSLTGGMNIGSVIGRGFSGLCRALLRELEASGSNAESRTGSEYNKDVNVEAGLVPLLQQYKWLLDDESRHRPFTKARLDAAAHFFPMAQNATQGATGTVGQQHVVTAIGTMLSKIFLAACGGAVEGSQLKQRSVLAKTLMKDPILLPLLLLTIQRRSIALIQRIDAGDAIGPTTTGGFGATQILARKMAAEKAARNSGGTRRDVINCFGALTACCEFVPIAAAANAGVVAFLHSHESRHDATKKGSDEDAGFHYKFVLRVISTKSIHIGEPIRLPYSLLSSTFTKMGPPAHGSEAETFQFNGHRIVAGLCSRAHLENVLKLLVAGVKRCQKFEAGSEKNNSFSSDKPTIQPTLIAGRQGLLVASSDTLSPALILAAAAAPLKPSIVSDDNYRAYLEGMAEALAALAAAQFDEYLRGTEQAANTAARMMNLLQQKSMEELTRKHS